MRANRFIRGRARPRQRHTPGKMNKTEQRYAELLEGRRLAGEIVGWRFEAYKLRLADNTFFTVDFVVQLPSGEIQLHELKASTRGGKTLIEDDAMVKIKVAASLYPEFRFCLVVDMKSGNYKYQWMDDDE